MKYLVSAAAICLSLGVGGCNIMTEPGNLNASKVQVNAYAFSEDKALSEVDDGYIAALARHYARHGDGGMDLVVAYDPRSATNTAMFATNKVVEISESLRDYGVVEIDPSILPVKGQGDEGRLFVAYDAYVAQAPEDCTLMPGMEKTTSVDGNRDYAMGCTIETMLAKQVSRPKDLMGRGVVDMTTEGRAAANAVEYYRSGVRNEPLEGESASGDD